MGMGVGSSWSSVVDLAFNLSLGIAERKKLITQPTNSHGNRFKKAHRKPS
jgi:hypothetical protein